MSQTDDPKEVGYGRPPKGKAVYSELKNLCVWVKDNGGMGSLYRSQQEMVLFKHGKRGHRNNVQLGQFDCYLQRLELSRGQFFRTRRL
jgi:hypothetical protein